MISYQLIKINKLTCQILSTVFVTIDYVVGDYPINEKKLANALFGQKNQYPALFPKLIREMHLFCNSIIRKSRFMKNSIIGLSSYIQPFCQASVVDVDFSN